MFMAVAQETRIVQACSASPLTPSAPPPCQSCCSRGNLLFREPESIAGNQTS